MRKTNATELKVAKLLTGFQVILWKCLSHAGARKTTPLSTAMAHRAPVTIKVDRAMSETRLNTVVRTSSLLRGHTLKVADTQDSCRNCRRASTQS